jgi:hypothetical protein
MCIIPVVVAEVPTLIVVDIGLACKGALVVKQLIRQNLSGTFL